jgi:hypothetical protein
MQTKSTPRLFDALAMGGLMLALLWGFWQMLANLSGAQSNPAIVVTSGAAAQPLSGYPGPTASAFPPTPTLLPDPGIRLGIIERLSDKSADLSFAPSGSPRFIYPATDSHALVGVVVTGIEPFGYVAAVDLATGKSQRIADVWSPGDPQVSSQYVVWTDKGRLYVYDQVSAKIEQLMIGDAARDLSLSDSIVVWENISQGQTLGIWGYDLATGKDFPVVKATEKAKAYKPLISGQWVLYQSASYKDGETRIGLNVANLDTDEGLELGQLPYLRYYVPPLYAIDAPWVAWSAYEWGVNPGLHLYNLDTHLSYAVAVPGCGLDELHQGNIYHVVISGTIVLFRGCYQSDGMGYDIEGGKFFSAPITQAEAQEAAFVDWAFAKGQLVWSLTVGPRWEEQTRVYAAPIIRDDP